MPPVSKSLTTDMLRDKNLTCPYPALLTRIRGDWLKAAKFLGGRRGRDKNAMRAAGHFADRGAFSVCFSAGFSEPARADRRSVSARFRDRHPGAASGGPTEPQMEESGHR